MSEKIGNRIIKLDRIDSTNNYATNRLFREDWPEGTVVVADEQIKGRGQLTNSWESEPGENLLLSIVFYPKFLPIQRQFQISKVIALSVSEIVSLYSENISVKWPNDVYAGERKIAGILIENAIMGNELSYSVAGIGLNINQTVFRGDAPNPVSLSQLTNVVFNRDEILKLLLDSVDKWYNLLQKGDIATIDMAYLNMLYRLDSMERYEDEQGIFTGRILGVNAIGQLAIEKNSGEVHFYHFKEVAFL